MSAMTDYLEGEIIKHIFRTGSFTKPTVLGVALFTAAPGETGGGTEVTGGNYSRVSGAGTTNPADSNWPAPAGGDGHTDNTNQLTYPAPNANWGVVTSYGLFDAATVGNLLIYGTLSASKTINSGDPAPYFAAGALDFTFA